MSEIDVLVAEYLADPVANRGLLGVIADWHEDAGDDLKSRAARWLLTREPGEAKMFNRPNEFDWFKDFNPDEPDRVRCPYHVTDPVYQTLCGMADEGRLIGLVDTPYRESFVTFTSPGHAHAALYLAAMRVVDGSRGVTPRSS